MKLFKETMHSPCTILLLYISEYEQEKKRLLKKNQEFKWKASTVQSFQSDKMDTARIFA